VESTSDAAICKFCQTPFITEKAINHYNTFNNTTNNIRGDVVNVYGVSSADFVIRAGMLEKYSGMMTDVIIPTTVSEIGIEAFSGCSSLKSISIPDSVTRIGNRAFYGCRSLTDIVIPNSVMHIGYRAFEATGLKNVLIPNSIKTIDYSAFKNCSNLENIAILGETIIKSNWAGSQYMFCGCNSLVNINIHSGTKVLFKKTDSWGDRLDKEIVIPEDIESLTNEELDVLAVALGVGSFARNIVKTSINNVDIQKLYNERYEQRRQQEQQERWQRQGLCSHCGGKFGIFSEKCKNCGRRVAW